MMKKRVLFNVLLFLSIGLLFSCKKEEGIIDDTFNKDYSSGVLITHEGLFQTGTGSVSFFDPGTGLLVNEIFNKENKRPLGNIAQSSCIFQGRTYIVVNNANKMEVVNSVNFKSMGTFEATTLPRYFLGINESKGYLSQWGNMGIMGQVLVLDINSMQILKSINTGSGSDFMLKINELVYVANRGGFGNDSTVAVIDCNTDDLIDHIEAKYNPNSIQSDANGKLWILCSGKWKGDWSELEHSGSLLRVDPYSLTTELELHFDSKFSEPKQLISNASGTMLYYSYNGAVYAHDIRNEILETKAYIHKSAYSLGFDKKMGIVYVGVPLDYVSKAYVFRYDAQNASLIDSFKTGIIPTHFEFAD